MKSFSTTIPKSNIDSLAIGSFDGIHLAHQELIKRLSSNGALLVIDKKSANLTPKDRRAYYSKHPCFYCDFEKIKDLSGKEFVDYLKSEFANLKKIVVGYDFSFGKNRANSANDLKEFFDGSVEIVEEFKIDGLSVHSSTIRELLKSGEIKKANKLLGRQYCLSGKVIRGQGLGKKELVPTINLEVSDYLLPKSGVYATKTKVKDKIFDSVSFIGIRVSTDGKFSVETHLLTDDEIAPSSSIEICFFEYLRENKKFESLNELKEQIEKDIIRVKECLKNG